MQAESAKQTNQTKQPIEMHKKYKTRYGHPVRILCVDHKDVNEQAYSVVALVITEAGEEVQVYSKTGQYFIDDYSALDLIEVQPWDDFKIDDPVIVSDNGLSWSKRYFAGVNSNGLPTAFNNGTTSFTVPHPTHITEWNYCKKPGQV